MKVDNILIIWLLTAATLLSSCQSDEQFSSEDWIINYRPGHNIPLASFVDRIRLIPLETDSAALIGRPLKLRFFEGTYYLLDVMKDRIVAFDTLGNFQFAIDRKGEGPNTYASLTDFYLDPADGNINLLANPNQLFTFSKNGDFISRVRLNLGEDLPIAHKMAKISKNRIVLFQNTSPSEQVYIYDLTEQRIVYRGIVSKDINRSYRYLPMEVFFNQGDQLFFFNNEDNTVFQVRDDSLAFDYRISLPTHNFNMDDYNSNARGLSMFAYLADRPIAHPIYALDINRDFVVLNYRNDLKVLQRTDQDSYNEVIGFPKGKGVYPIWPYATPNHQTDKVYGMAAWVNDSFSAMTSLLDNPAVLDSLLTFEKDRINPVVIEYWLKPNKKSDNVFSVKERPLLH